MHKSVVDSVVADNNAVSTSASSVQI